MANFILADNQDLTALGMEALLRQTADATIYHAKDKAQLVSWLMEQELTTVILDYTLFDFETQEQLLVVIDRFPLASWILISDGLTMQHIRKMVYTCPRVSIVFKDSPLNIIRNAISAANHHSRYICPRATEILLLQEQSDATTEHLTQTEIEVIRAIAQGKTTKEIAAERYSSIHTINTHRKNIFRKLNVNTAHEAVKHAFRAGLIETDDFYI